MRTISGVAASAIIALSAALLAVGAGALPAAARPEPAPASAVDGPCLLERIGAQLVRCDDLTGDGVAAPDHVPEQP